MDYTLETTKWNSLSFWFFIIHSLLWMVAKHSTTTYTTKKPSCIATKQSTTRIIYISFYIIFEMLPAVCTIYSISYAWHSTRVTPFLHNTVRMHEALAGLSLSRRLVWTLASRTRIWVLITKEFWYKLYAWLSSVLKIKLTY